MAGFETYEGLLSANKKLSRMKIGINNFRYAKERYGSIFAILSGICGMICIAKIPLYIRIAMIIICFLLPLVLPLIESIIKKNFSIHTVGNSIVTFKFGNLFKEECIVLTSTRYFDVDPDNKIISENSVIGQYAIAYMNKYHKRLKDLVEAEIKEEEIQLPVKYGDSIKLDIDGKIVYLLAFTDRKKSEQSLDFYPRTLQNFFKMCSDENHGKVISIPLIGDNNNLSDTGFKDSRISLDSIIAMINYFEVTHLSSTLKLQIVALPDKRAELIDMLHKF